MGVILFCGFIVAVVFSDSCVLALFPPGGKCVFIGEQWQAATGKWDSTTFIGDIQVV